MNINKSNGNSFCKKYRLHILISHPLFHQNIQLIFIDGPNGGIADMIKEGRIIDYAINIIDIRFYHHLIIRERGIELIDKDIVGEYLPIHQDIPFTMVSLDA
jgi:hypothetical protein